MDLRSTLSESKLGSLYIGNCRSMRHEVVGSCSKDGQRAVSFSKVLMFGVAPMFDNDCHSCVLDIQQRGGPHG